mmetsp:Transcript_261/g.1076  ORF Transcript_261/g.1076 Transcript_261/m.1076 type:complete len:212 (+) Transcript_261:1590-2225(+)|eukprot:scaffold7052_cov254-Pinguiococcus_pyrenoidosus.AAC.78
MPNGVIARSKVLAKASSMEPQRSITATQSIADLRGMIEKALSFTRSSFCESLFSSGCARPRRRWTRFTVREMVRSKSGSSIFAREDATSASTDWSPALAFFPPPKVRAKAWRNPRMLSECLRRSRAATQSLGLASCGRGSRAPSRVRASSGAAAEGYVQEEQVLARAAHQARRILGKCGIAPAYNSVLDCGIETVRLGSSKRSLREATLQN